jgi:hypothetical protein
MVKIVEKLSQTENSTSTAKSTTTAAGNLRLFLRW